VSDEADARASAITSAVSDEATARASAITSAITIAVPAITKFASPVSSTSIYEYSFVISASYHSFDSSATLRTIDGGSNGQLLTLDISLPATLVRIETSGNIVLNNNQPYFDLIDQNSILLMYRSSKWCEISRSVINIARLDVYNAFPNPVSVPITLTDHISSDNLVTSIVFEITSGSGSGSIVGPTFTPTNPGTVTITATQAGDGSNYSAAVPLTFDVTVN
jgi:hypothetical protein